MTVVSAVSSLALLMFPAGPVGAAPAVPGWEVLCNYSHSRTDDPIVYPRKAGMSHTHDFFGNTETNAYSTPATLRDTGSRTNCELSADRAAYWAPALYINGVKTSPLRLHTYYRWGNINNLRSIKPISYAARMIGGNSKATHPQSTSVIGWSCGRQGEALAHAPKDCRGTRNGQNGSAEEVLHVFFPNCFNSAKPSADPAAYSYSYHGACLIGYPILRLSFDVAYPAAAPSTYTLAGMNAAGQRITSAPIYTAHADFMNGWATAVMNRLTTDCVKAGVQCGPLRDGGRR